MFLNIFTIVMMIGFIVIVITRLLDSIGQKDSVPVIETAAQTVTVPEPTVEKSDDKDVSRATRKSRTNNVR